jgi:hypothetical protein
MREAPAIKKSNNPKTTAIIVSSGSDTKEDDIEVFSIGTVLTIAEPKRGGGRAIIKYLLFIVICRSEKDTTIIQT